MRAGGLSIWGVLALLTFWLAGSPPTAAAALEPGVHIDPGSPAAKEYVLPLNKARQTGGGSGSNGSSASAGLFGAGITPPSGGGSASSGSASHGGSRTSHPQGGRHAPTAPAVPVPPPAAVLRATHSQNSSAGSGSLLALLGGGLAVLILGGFGGTVLRHSRRPHRERPTQP